MELTRLVLTAAGVAKLTAEERTFLALAGQFSNDLTILHKLMTASFREPPAEIEHKANAVLVGVLLKTVASKLLQGWELVAKAFDGAQVGRAPWLRSNVALQEALGRVRAYFARPNPIAEIRNQFGSHYDTAPMASQLDAVLAENGFEMLCGDKVVNCFYMSSEVATWSAVLKTVDDAQFEVQMKALVLEVADISGEFLGLLNLVAEAFCKHVVRDLGGELTKMDSLKVTTLEPSDAVLPLFAA
jgi:hypothetical protein